MPRTARLWLDDAEHHSGTLPFSTFEDLSKRLAEFRLTSGFGPMVTRFRDTGTMLNSASLPDTDPVDLHLVQQVAPGNFAPPLSALYASMRSAANMHSRARC